MKKTKSMAKDIESAKMGGFKEAEKTYKQEIDRLKKIELNLDDEIKRREQNLTKNTSRPPKLNVRRNSQRRSILLKSRSFAPRQLRPPSLRLRQGRREDSFFANSASV